MLQISIPLYHPDLTVQDRAAVMQALTLPWQDAAALSALESGWSQQWGRAVVAFADAQQAIGALLRLWGWRRGDALALSPLADRVWGEALQQHGLWPAWLDVEPQSGLVQGEPLGLAGCAGGLVGWLHGGFGGVPERGAAQSGAVSLMVMDHMPLAQIADDALGLLHLGPNGPLQGAGITLIAATHNQQAAKLRELRGQALPSRGAVALAMSQFHQRHALFARRAEVAARYGALLRPRGRFGLPQGWAYWSRYPLSFEDEVAAQGLAEFLGRTGIGGMLGGPLPPIHSGPGLRGWSARTLLLPCYAALGEAAQKRVINRVHRWLERS
ncbi:hypothetical protein Mmc1_3733 [Magnetococcus marinus MC-1]|uniref:DegT/DnrJ/EryC1/StrS aminotransferase n=2 Tax=Magnetococcus TaxID=162171 RepID=A0LE25_MAGMM|nr:hypothetical protein Mmc1_3733 [Magnetococcus marinus MC-1]